MTAHRYPTLLVAALAATFIGAAAAQTQSDDTSRLPAKKGTAQESQTQPSNDQPDKMKGQDQYGQMNSEQSKQPQAMKSTEGGKQATKSTDDSKQAMDSSKKEKHAAGSTDASHHAMDSGKKHTHASSADSSKHAMNTAGTKHAGKSKRQAEESGAPDEKAYREALRDCAKQQEETQRGSCLDSAIERFHRNV